MDFSISPLIITVVSTHFLALLSPGPDFVMIIKSSMNCSKRESIGVPLGIAIANAIYITLCLLGIGEIVIRMTILLNLIKFSGGLFFLYIAIKSIKANRESYQNIFFVDSGQRNRSFATLFINGFMSGISNPKNLIFYLGLFSIILTNETDYKLKIGLGLWMVLVVFIWDSIILLLLSQQKVQKHFKKIIYYVDKITGIILGVLGMKLILMSIF